MTDTDDGSSEAGEVPEAAGVTAAETDDVAPAMLPSRRRLLIVAAAVAALLVAVGAGAYLYLTSADDVDAAKEQAAAEAARAAAEKDAALRAASQPLIEAARRANDAILAADTPIPAPRERLSSNAPVAIQPAVTAPAATQPAATRAATSNATVPPVDPDASVANDPPRKAAESAIGPEGCKLSGDSPQDFGSALGRCLQEFNRLDGR